VNPLCNPYQAGVDLRCNYKDRFAFDNEGSDGKSYCETHFRGERFFSEKESSAIRDLITSLKASGATISLVVNIDSDIKQNVILYPNNFSNQPRNGLLAT
jgi:hypothetical protein